MEPPFPADELLRWYDREKRTLPWRETDDPYRIWVSEIMLQQTRVSSVIPYYERFIREFPTLEALATADRNRLMQIWEGLGYYSRARNLQDAARSLVDSGNGVIPDSYDGLIELKGIGPYTAAAIASIAFDRAVAVVDGNVIRVLSRFYGLRQEMRSEASKKLIREHARNILTPHRPGDFNQALMELGATVCTPTSPTCSECPLAGNCLAFRRAETDLIPWLPRKKPVPHKTIGVGIIEDDRKRVLIALRPESAMLGGLWEFPGGKKRNTESIRETVRREIREELGVAVTVGQRITRIRHAYSHFRITMHAYRCSLEPAGQTPHPHDSQEVRWVEPERLTDFPFPAANRKLTRILTGEEKL